MTSRASGRCVRGSGDYWGSDRTPPGRPGGGPAEQLVRRQAKRRLGRPTCALAGQTVGWQANLRAGRPDGGLAGQKCHGTPGERRFGLPDDQLRCRAGVEAMVQPLVQPLVQLLARVRMWAPVQVTAVVPVRRR